jgi:hypothetical protein
MFMADPFLVAVRLVAPSTGIVRGPERHEKCLVATVSIDDGYPGTGAIEADLRRQGVR